jgi:hypothetical protein
MTNVVSEAVNAVDSIAPNTPASQIADAVVSTSVSPSPENIVADIELAISLIKQLMPLVKQHPSILTIVKWLF